MAIVDKSSPFFGFRGKVNGLIIRNFKGKTVAQAKYEPTPSNTEKQQTNRARFRMASEFAKAELKDPEKQEYYRALAVDQKLPNGYVAAIRAWLTKR